MTSGRPGRSAALGPLIVELKRRLEPLIRQDLLSGTAAYAMAVCWALLAVFGVHDLAQVLPGESTPHNALESSIELSLDQSTALTACGTAA